MQSGYGVSEIPQFLVDGLCSPLFPSAAPDQHPPPHHHHHHHPSNSAAAPPYHFYHYQQQQPQQQLQQFYHLQAQPPPPPPQPPHLDSPRFPHFHPIPITQQLFEQTHQFQLFEHQRRTLHTHLGLEHDSPPPPAPPSPARIVGAPPFMNFRLAVNESSAGGRGASRDGLNDDDGLLQGDDEDEDATIKEPFWRPLDIDYITRNNSKSCKDNEPLEQSPPKHSKETKDMGVPDQSHEEATNSATNYKLFSELEAICKPGATASAPAATANNNPTGSSSALTGENRPAPLAPNYAEFVQDHGSNASTGDEEGSLKNNNPPKSSSTTSSKARRRKRRKQQFSSIASFFESLVKQLMDHQEALHHRFLEALESRDHERARKEQQWREQEATRTKQEAQARAEQQVVAAAREAAIVSFLEKITGQPLNLPSRAQFDLDDYKHGNNTATTEGSDETRAAMNSNRWPKAEVQALINVRSGLESRFQEPGLKGPLWEEVSSIMVAMGYRRNAKRCKEKWENINKYYRKTKESNKKRPQHSKTCPYFHQLDQLYSNSHANDSPMEVDRRGNSELLDAIVVHTDQIGSRSLEYHNPKELDCDQDNERHGHGDDDDNEYQDGEEDDDNEEGNEEEEEAEAQGTMLSSQRQHNDEAQLSSHASLFFHTLQSQ